MRPIAKPLLSFTRNGVLTAVRTDGRLDGLADQTGTAQRILRLSDGSRDLDQIIAECGTANDVTAPSGRVAPADMVDQLDARGWLAVTDPELLDRAAQERYASNLGFFTSFSSLDRSREDFQATLANARVLLLGVGGPGSSILLNLAGLGVGHVRVVDYDIVELTNLNRQFLYAESDIGQSKADCAVRRAASINSSGSYLADNSKITGPEQVRELLRGVDLVFCAMDQPQDVRVWINQACVQAAIPLVLGGVSLQFGFYYSVRPGSPCHQCLVDMGRAVANGLDLRLTPPPVNPTLGPMAIVLGGLMALEGVRYLTGFASRSAPAGSGRSTSRRASSEKPSLGGRHMRVRYAALHRLAEVDR